MPHSGKPTAEPHGANLAFVWLHSGRVADHLPPPQAALPEPNGLLAVGGNLEPQTLLRAYAEGIFPWFNEGEAILWWSPNPRCVLYPDQVKVSRSLRRRMADAAFRVTADQAFDAVVAACATPRSYSAQTWISDQMASAYGELHRRGHGHSIEVYQEEELVGGLYGVALGRIFFGESMFHRRTDASKIALVVLCRQLQRWGFTLIDCQVSSQHLIRMGAIDMERQQFLRLLSCATQDVGTPGSWILDDDL